MQIDEETCYRAMASRDRRFEGRFVIGVRTTGIYCRPGCPARLPRRENVHFFASPAAAEASGLRACLRCRPDAAPGSPAWIGTPATVTRALRLIAGGALQRGRLGDLAARLGIGERHLRRLFESHLGASPLAVLHCERMHLARRLLEESTLPITQVAFDAGFTSVRRFNDAILRTFARSPQKLRAQGIVRSPAPADALRLRLAFHPPYSWDTVLAFLAARAIPGVERVHAGAYQRTARLGDAQATLQVTLADGQALQVTVRGAARLDAFALTARMRRLFDLDADPEAITAHLRRDPALAKVLQPGLRVPGAWDEFEVAVRGVLGQQISVRAATTLAGRIAARCGEPLREPAGTLTHLFPTPQVLAAADVTELTRLGLPRARAVTIHALASAVAAGSLSLSGWPSLEAGVAALLALPGIGDFTAQYIALRAAGEPDALPAGDLGLRKHFAAPSGMLASPAQVRERTQLWRPFRAYGVMAIWQKGLVI